MLAIRNAYGIHAIAFWTSIVLAIGSYAKLASTFGSWVKLVSIVGYWVGLTRQITSPFMLVSLDLCTHIVACSYLGSWT